jgi:hypothetical protein
LDEAETRWWTRSRLQDRSFPTTLTCDINDGFPTIFTSIP